MRIYPAIKAHMGDWQYYMLRMRMREIAHQVHFAHDIYRDNTLSHSIKRMLGEGCIKTEIAGYLSHRPDRFFSSIVVAAMEGEPMWHPVELDRDSVPVLFTGSSSLRDSFGVLSFGDEPKYYALDGQHRVAAIKLLVKGEAEVPAPEGFDDDLLSVIVVLKEEHDLPEGEWMKRYRRLFSSLNRYAKPTDRDTNIIMDEDDLFAIVTRRLITEHEFFQAPGPERESFKVLTKGRNLRVGAGHFTTLQILYEMNERLLRTREREIRGWSAGGTRLDKLDKQTRPDEEEIDTYHEELVEYWDAILAVLPVLRERPEQMRIHTLPEPNPDHYQDHLLFWPIGQLLFARLVRSLLDHKFPEGTQGGKDELAAGLSPLAQIPWELHAVPWRYLLLVPSPEKDSWRMRNEERKEALEVAYRLLCWITELDSLGDDDTNELREDWQNLLYGLPADDERVGEMWREVGEIRARIVTGA